MLAIQDGLQLKGWIVTISGFLIVILALVVLFLIFTGVSKLINADWKKLFNKDKTKDEVEVVENNNKDMILCMRFHKAISNQHSKHQQ